MRWTRKQLKKDGRKAVRQNYLRCVIVCLVLAFMAGAYASQLGGEAVLEVGADAIQSVNFRSASSTQIVNQLLYNVGDRPVGELLPEDQTRLGIAANLFNNITRSGSFVFGILNGINQMIFGDRVMAGIIILVGAAITFLYWLLVGNLLRIGECRFFLENRSYRSSRVDRLLYLYRIRRIKNPAKIMFFKTLYVVLWSFTIAGGFIKYYAYRMVPYITAENPDIPMREAFALSEQMMLGNKWRAFVLDASFWGWGLLNWATLGFLNWLYVNPYRAATEAELYLRLRQTVENAEIYLNDTYLACEHSDEELEYPVNLHPIPEHINSAWISGDYAVHYPLVNLVVMFFVFAVGGWVWEVIVDLINTGGLVNRGTLHGPWLPIYGIGAVAVIVLFRRFGKRPVLLFGLVVGFCAAMEYFTSWLLEYLTGERWWDYSGYFLNLNGRICLEGLLVFGLGACMAIYLIGPSLNNLLEKMPKKVKLTLCIMLGAVFCADLGISALNPNTDAVVRQ